MAFPSTNTAQPTAPNGRSGIMNVDFFEETIIFTKMDVLRQSGVFALSQATASTTSVLNLPQEISRHN